MTAQAICEFLAAEAFRLTAPEQAIVGVAAAAEGGPDRLVFAGDAASLAAALASGAGALLVATALRPELEAAFAARAVELLPPNVLLVREVRLAFARVAERLRPRLLESQIDRSAMIAVTARLGARLRLGAGVIVEDGVVIGDDCELDARVVVHAGTTLGRGVRVKAGAVLGSAGFGFARDAASGAYVPFPQQGRLRVGDAVAIGANATIDRGALGETIIGDGTKIDNLVHIAHNCRIGRNVVIAAQTGIAGSSEIGDGAVIGGQVGIADHVRIGPGVILGAKAGVPSHKVIDGPGQVFWGIPARPIQQYLRELARMKRER